MSKLHFTNDCDPDLTICELQHENDKLMMVVLLQKKQIEDAEKVISEIHKDSNPAYLVEKKEKYLKEQKILKGEYNE
tara:strand:- start:479 stop:709 length:231 start_codon:yes stop_codon:yes gene_type:complete